MTGLFLIVLDDAGCCGLGLKVAPLPREDYDMHLYNRSNAHALGGASDAEKRASYMALMQNQRDGFCRMVKAVTRQPVAACKVANGKKKRAVTGVLEVQDEDWEEVTYQQLLMDYGKYFHTVKDDNLLHAIWQQLHEPSKLGKLIPVTSDKKAKA